MNSLNELKWNELNHSYQPSNLSFRTTQEIESMNNLLAQEDAIESIRQGLQMEYEGYNLYVCGTYNKQIEETIMCEVKKVAMQKKPLMAVGYIYNFDVPEEPIVLGLHRLDAMALKQDLEEFRAFIIHDIPLLLEQEEMQMKKAALIDEFEKLTERYETELEERAANHHIQIKKIEESIQFIPLTSNDENYTKEMFLKLSTEEQNTILENISELQDYLEQITILLEEKEQEYIELYSELGQEVILREVGKNIKRLVKKYSVYPELTNYFNKIAEEILNQLEILEATADESIELEQKVRETLQQEIEQMVKRYDINLISVPKEDGAPIINDIENPRQDLVGSILMDVENGSLQSDFLNIRPGLLNDANGGYLILHMDELIQRSKGWQQLKSVLRNGKMYIEGNEELGIHLSRAIKPQPVPIQVKVILFGNEAVYGLLANYDEDFKKLFKIKAAFKGQIDMNSYPIDEIAKRIKGLAEKEDILPVSSEGLLRIIEYGCRRMEHPNKISSDLDWIMDILREAQYDAVDIIDKQAVEKCLIRREKISNAIKEQLDESLQDGTYLIDTRGAKVGQINGLAVYEVGEYSFGRPIRITATTYRGKQGLVDIENEAKLSGAIHTKGIHIITGFLGYQFAQDIPLSLNCNICFEQSYAGVDGDSASSAELIAILSSLSEIPLYQNIAVTGSINQFGEVQPVGGINEKIEGFFQVCKQRGLNGQEGVMIPRNNVRELLLDDEVVEAVKKQLFHIYAITNIWEGIEIMTGQKKEEIQCKVQEKLIRFNQ